MSKPSISAAMTSTHRDPGLGTITNLSKSTPSSSAAAKPSEARPQTATHPRLLVTSPANVKATEKPPDAAVTPKKVPFGMPPSGKSSPRGPATASIEEEPALKTPSLSTPLETRSSSVGDRTVLPDKTGATAETPDAFTLTL
jgi:hypothetical protein